MQVDKGSTNGSQGQQLAAKSKTITGQGVVTEGSVSVGVIGLAVQKVQEEPTEEATTADRPALAAPKGTMGNP